MRDFNPGSGVRPKALEFAGLTNGGSLVPFTPRSLFSNAQKTATAALAGSFAEGALAAPALNTAAASSRATGQKSRTTTKAPGGRNLQHLRAAARGLPMREDRPTRLLAPHWKQHHRQLLGG
jgi:hypothetical protein